MSLFDEASLPDPSPVMAATRWRNNSDMMIDVRKLGYITDESFTLDPTFQDGTWWINWQPDRLITNSLDPANGADLCFDFRRPPFPPKTFQVITYDPPYVVKGGRETSTMKDHQRRYGIDTAPTRPAELQTLINHGLVAMFDLLEVGGCLLFKNQDYTSSGKVWWGTDLARAYLTENRSAARFVDRLYFLNNGSAQDDSRTKKCPTCKGTGDPRPEDLLLEPPASQCDTCEGEGRVESKQQHARVNVSTLWVIRKLPPRKGK